MVGWARSGLALGPFAFFNGVNKPFVSNAVPTAIRVDGASAHVNNFDGLRLLAAMLILYGHQGQLTGHFDLSGTARMRTLAFFAISGYLVFGSWLSDPHAGRFLWRRVLRVWPAYAVMIVICSFFAYVFAVTNLHRLAATFYLNNLYFYGFDWGFFGGDWPAMNLSIWTLPMEVNCYLALALVGLLGRHAVTVSAAAVALFAGFTYAPAAPVAPQIAPADWDSTWTLYFGGFFCAGMLWRQVHSAWLTPGVLCCLIFGAASLALGWHTIGLMLMIPSAAAWIGVRSWPVLRSASRYGDLSLGIFLWAWPVQQVTLLWLGFHQPFALQLVVVTPQVLAVAWLSRKLIELPVMRFKPGRERQEPAKWLCFDGQPTCISRFAYRLWPRRLRTW